MSALFLFLAIFFALASTTIAMVAEECKGFPDRYTAKPQFYIGLSLVSMIAGIWFAYLSGRFA